MNYYGDQSMTNNGIPSMDEDNGQNFTQNPYPHNYQNPSMGSMGMNQPVNTAAPQQAQASSLVPRYASGGEVKDHGREKVQHNRRGMEDVYMNPEEISIMDKLQGDKNNYDRDGVKNYSKLWHIINNPHLMRAGWEGHYKDLPSNSYARGGSVDDAPEGRFGDTKRVRMPKKMADTLDKILMQTGKNPSRNPKTGHREYFGLKGFFNGIGQRIVSNNSPQPIANSSNVSNVPQQNAPQPIAGAPQSMPNAAQQPMSSQYQLRPNNFPMPVSPAYRLENLGNNSYTQ